MDKKKFYENLWKIALPVTIQSFLQSLLSLIDGMMIGDLGSASIGGVGLGTKFISLFQVTVSAIVAVAGIMIAQYKGDKNKKGINDSFFSNLYFSLVIAAVFVAISVGIPNQIMSLYSDQPDMVHQARTYLTLMAIGFIPQTITLMLSALLRNMECAKVPMIASAVSVIANTVFNYLLIFGIGIFPKMDVAGAALATSCARILELIIVLVIYLRVKDKKGIVLKPVFRFQGKFLLQIVPILMPLLITEFLWSLGENVYAVIYGHFGTNECAAMTLTYPLQTIVIGALSGLSAAAGIIVGNTLGEGKSEIAYNESKLFLKLTVLASIGISVIIALVSKFYVQLFNVNQETKTLTIYILLSYCIVFTAKVTNMVLGGGILRSGGKTKYSMMIDLIGTWCIGVPVGFLAAKVFKLPIYQVYLILSLEEYVRVLISSCIFKSRKWIVNITKVD